jgi:glycerophosphoryl diester phosphodiesterase
MTITTLLHQLRGRWRTIVSVHLLFTLLGAAILTPLFGLILQGALSMSGSAAVVDQDIARLLLSPLGMVGGIILVALFLAIAGLEMGAMQVVAQANQSGKEVSAGAATRFALSRAPALLKITLRLTLCILAYLLPYLAMVAAIAWTQLTDYDINFYLAEKPPAFFVVVAAALVLATPLVYLLGRRLISWSLVLPIALFSSASPLTAFAESEAHTAGQHFTCLRRFAAWLVMALLLASIPVIVLQLGMDLVLANSGKSLTTLALILGILGATLVALNFVVTALNLAGFCFVVAELAQQLYPQEKWDLNIADKRTSPLIEKWTLTKAGIVLALVATLGAGVLIAMLRSVSLDDDVLIIAHRGAAGSAPENTMAAISQAIADGADWIEIDVQESRDGHVVVVHDSDFMKLAGDPVKVWEGDLKRLQQIDIGSWFDPAFADERVPTLAQVLALIKENNARLVIELKYYGHDQALEQRVVDAVETADMASSVAIMSLKLDGVNKLKALRPEWTGGLLAATAVGDITRLNADFLAVNQNMANPAFIRRAHKAGKKVFVWTVNDPLSLSHWTSMGVDGVITDEPALAREILKQRAELSPAQRLMLSGALFFGKPDALKKYRDNSP